MEMLAAIRAIITKYEVYCWLAIIVVMMTLTWRAHTILDEARQAVGLKVALDAQHDADKKQFDHDLAEAKKQTVIDHKNDNLNQKVENEIKAHPNPCLIPLGRVQLINQATSRK